jgi:hypothetical protein
MPKTVLPSKFQEWKGVDRITIVVHEMKCIFREINKDDYGMDGEIEVVVPKPDGKGYETTGGIIKLQAKSGAKYVVRDSETSFSTPVEKADLEGWHKSTFPVLLVVYHPADDKLYWKEIRSYVENTPGVFKPPLHVVFDKTADEFTAAARDRICQAAEVSPPRITMEQQERLYSNLFRVKQLPKILTSAPTDYIDVQHLQSELTGARPPLHARRPARPGMRVEGVLRHRPHQRRLGRTVGKRREPAPGIRLSFEPTVGQSPSALRPQI